MEFKDGTTISTAYRNVIGHRLDASLPWSYYIKSKIKEIRPADTKVRLIFDDSTELIIDIAKVTQPTTWTDAITAANDLATWIHNPYQDESLSSMVDIYARLGDINSRLHDHLDVNWTPVEGYFIANQQFHNDVKKYIIGDTGFNIIQSTSGTILASC